MKVKLKVISGSSAGREILIKGPRYSIGRNADCNLRPKSDMISRLHCTFVFEGTRLFLEDAGSKNGSLINGERVEGIQNLSSGDELQIGPLKFEVIISVSSEAAAKAEAEPSKEEAKQPSEIAGDTDDDAFTSWLDEADEKDRARRLSDPDTRQFKLDEADREALEKAAKVEAEKGGASSKKGRRAKAAKKKKKEPGKLPPPPEQVSEDSTEAAAHMLKKLFERR